MKKKTKAKTAKKAAKRKTAAPKKQPDASQVHNDIAGMVKKGARVITKAVIVHAMRGELAPAKYLFEMAGLYPAATDGGQATPGEDCLAKTLLDRLGPAQKPASSEPESAASTVEDADQASTESSTDPAAADVLPSSSGSS